MAYKLEPCSISRDLEAAVIAVDDVLRREKTAPIAIFSCGDGKPTIKKYNKDGSTTTLTRFGSYWHEGVKVDG